MLEAITKVNDGQPLAEKDNFVKFKPMDVRFPYMMVPRSQISKDFETNPNQFSASLFKVNVEAEKWKAESRFHSRHLRLYSRRSRRYRDGNKGAAGRVWVCKEGATR